MRTCGGGLPIWAWVCSSALIGAKRLQQISEVVRLTSNQMGGAQLVEIIEALSVHPQLEKLDLRTMNVGRNECTALANLLRSTTTELQELDLCNNALMMKGWMLWWVLLANSKLRVLDLSSNRTLQPEDVRVLQLCWKIQTPTWRGSISR